MANPTAHVQPCPAMSNHVQTCPDMSRHLSKSLAEAAPRVFDGLVQPLGELVEGLD